MNADKINLQPLFGLVVAGGKSQRMGRDKGLIDWHGKPQRYYMADMLAEFCSQVFISCRAEQSKKIVADGYQALPDASVASEQYGALLTAMQAQPNVAWLVIACDVPLVDQAVLANLVSQRDSTQLATAYRSPDNNLPEPLIAIWESNAQAMLEQKRTEGVSCPRKALILSQPAVKLIDPPSSASIMNVNTPAAASSAREYIKGKHVRR